MPIQENSFDYHRWWLNAEDIISESVPGQYESIGVAPETYADWSKTMRKPIYAWLELRWTPMTQEKADAIGREKQLEEQFMGALDVFIRFLTKHPELPTAAIRPLLEEVIGRYYIDHKNEHANPVGYIENLVWDIDKFIELAQREKACIINGNRMQNHQGMPWVRFCTNRLMSWLVSWACGQSIADTQCGYRYISSEILRAITLTSGDFEIESEILIKSSKKGFKVYSVPIKTIYRDEVSQIHPLKDTLRFIRYFVKEIFNL